MYRTVKLLKEAGVINRLEFGDGRARYEELGVHHEHLVDVEMAGVTEFYYAELEALKKQTAREMGMSWFAIGLYYLVVKSSERTM